MQNDVISIWWDNEGDFLSVTFADGEGDMVQTRDGKAMVKIDDQGKILGFHLLGVSKKTQRAPLRFELVPEEFEESSL